jgi:MFS family permease
VAISITDLSPESGAVASGKRSTRRALASLSLAVLLSSLGTSIANVGLPALADAFSASFHAVQWVVIAYLVAVTALIVVVGRLGDVVGRRRLLLVGLGLFTVASILCAAAPTLSVLIGARALQGLGAAIMMALAMAFVGATVPKAKMGSAMGLLGTMSAVGTALGPSLGGVLIAGFGWRALFLAEVPLGILTLLLARHDLPADDMRVMATAKAAVMRWELLRAPGLSAGLAMSALVSSVMMATLVVGPFHLSRGLGLDAAIVGLVMSVGPVVAALTGAPAGRFVDRVGARFMSMAGLSGMGTGSLLLSVLPATWGVAGYVAPIAVLTAGYALFQTANNTSVMGDVSADRRGVVSGLLNLSRNLGLITGASVMGAVFAAASAADDVTTADPAAVVTGMRVTFAVAALLVGLALAVAARTGAAEGRGLRGRDLLVRARQRVARPRLAERPEALEAGERTAHREDLFARTAGLDLRLDEGDDAVQIVAEAREIGVVAGDGEPAVRMAEDVDRVVRVVADRAIEHARPVSDRRARRPIDDRMALVEHQIAHVSDVGALERDDDVAAGVGAPVVARADALIAEVGRPRLGEPGVGEELVGGWLAARRISHVLVRLRVRDDVLRRAAE